MVSSLYWGGIQHLMTKAVSQHAPILGRVLKWSVYPSMHWAGNVCVWSIPACTGQGGCLGKLLLGEVYIFNFPSSLEALTAFRRHVLVGNVRCRRFSQRSVRVALDVETCCGFAGGGTGLRFLLGLYSDLVALNCTTNIESCVQRSVHTRRPRHKKWFV